MMKSNEEHILHSYDDVWPIVIRQHLSDSFVFGTPYVMMTDEKTLVNQLRSQLEVSKKYGVISNSKNYMTVALLSQNRRQAIVSEVIFSPSRKWGNRDNMTNFYLSMILRAYFEREDTFGWDRSKVIQHFKGMLQS